MKDLCFEGRQRRRIYEDQELHALMVALILALLVTPKRGLLDSRYCDQYPLQNHRRNIPYLLSVHLNHAANKAVLPWLFQQMESIGRIGAQSPWKPRPPGVADPLGVRRGLSRLSGAGPRTGSRDGLAAARSFASPQAVSGSSSSFARRPCTAGCTPTGSAWRAARSARYSPARAPPRARLRRIRF